MTDFVVDCPITMAWCFADETNPFADAALEALKSNHAVVPAIWPLEVANVLVTNERRGRLTSEEADQFLQQLSLFPIAIEHGTPDLAFDAILPLARVHRLTVYDAAYLELAKRRSLPLCTLDMQLKNAAAAASVNLFAG